MQGPTIVRSHELPALDRETDHYGIVLDIFDRSTDIFRRIEKDFPARAAPYGVVGGAHGGAAKPQAAGFLQICDHLFSKVFVLADQDMNVVRHNRTRVTGIAVVRDAFAKSICYFESIRRIQLKARGISICTSRRRRTRGFPFRRAGCACGRGGGCPDRR